MMDDSPKIINRREETVAIDTIKPHPANPNDGDVAAIAESIRQNGFYGRIVVRDSTGKILAGEHRWRAAQEVGLSEVPIEWVECDDETAMRILLADNRTAEKAEREPGPLADLLESLEQTDDGLNGTGYSGDDLDDLLEDLGKTDAYVGAEDQTDLLEERHMVLVECDGEEDQCRALEEVEKLGYTCHALIE